MDESSEKISARPEILQLSLGTLYRTLPMDPFEPKTRTELTDARTKQEQMLNVLLPNADITISLKEYIRKSFADGLALGRGKNRELFAWDMLGLEEPYLHPQGIFSTDPLVRMRIERDVYDQKKKELEDYTEKRKLVSGEELDFLINKDTAFLQEMRKEFEEQYGEPIVLLAPKH